MEDLSVLRAMMDHDLYTKYSPVLFGMEAQEPEYLVLLNAIKGYYSKYKDKKNISVDELKLYFSWSNPVSKNKETIFTNK